MPKFSSLHRPLPTLSACALACCAISGMAHAQEPVRLGFLTDMSSQYSDGDGKGGVTAIQMAIEDFGGKLLGRPIELLSADHQNKADIASTKSREWVDTQDVQLLIAGTNTATALAMGQVANEKKRVLLITKIFFNPQGNDMQFGGAERYLLELARLIRESSPPDATFASALSGCPGLALTSSSTCSRP